MEFIKTMYLDRVNILCCCNKKMSWVNLHYCCTIQPKVWRYLIITSLMCLLNILFQSFGNVVTGISSYSSTRALVALVTVWWRPTYGFDGQVFINICEDYCIVGYCWLKQVIDILCIFLSWGWEVNLTKTSCWWPEFMASIGYQNLYFLSKTYGTKSSN